MNVFRHTLTPWVMLLMLSLITCSCGKDEVIESQPVKDTTPDKETPKAEKDIITQNGGYETLLHIMQNLKKTAIGAGGASDTGYDRLLLLEASDIHNDTERLERMQHLRKSFSDYIDDAFICGDITGSSIAEWTGAFNSVDGYDKTLLCIGNHDTEKASSYSQVYDTFFKPNIANWQVTQPANAASNALCYYYKDYPRARVRFIVLDGEHWHSKDAETQKQWFKTVLEDARLKYYSVLAAVHRPAFELGNGFDSSFNSLELESFGGESHARDHIVECVDEFQRAGGEFICWLGGHTHTDYCGVFDKPYQNIQAFPRQLYFITGSAKQNVVWTDCVKVPDHKSQDLLNLIAIDTKTKHLIIHRIGADLDMFGRKKTSMTIDYSTPALLYTN